MIPFLKNVAEIFVREYPDDISYFCFVFPNRRAGTFFKKYLKESCVRTMLSPEITTIKDFFASLSDLTEDDPMALSLRLYKIYASMAKQEGWEPQTFDEFAPFSQTLLSDFDDIDNYLADASQLFTNAKELHEIDRSDYLSEEQRRVLSEFFKFHDSSETKERQARFFKTWQMLYPMYCRLKEELAAEGLCYPGMRDRITVEREHLDVPYEKVVFVGFNAISEVERRLFMKLKHKADFYWDYDSGLVRDPANKASFFVKRNLSDFPSRHSLTDTGTDSFPEVELWNISSSVGQCDIAGHIISKEMPESENGNAVVLSDENLLVPMLYRIPESHGKVNVTMTYPVRQTAIPLLVENFLLLKNSEENGTYYHKHVFDMLKHPYIFGNMELRESINGLLRNFTASRKIRIAASEIDIDDDGLRVHIFGHCEKPLERLAHLMVFLADNGNFKISGMEREMLLDCSASIGRLSRLMEKWNISPSVLTLMRSIISILSSKGVAFEGEPLAGLQIMGMLETRCLDFDNIIICSFNEGIFPKTELATSFIPYNLRKAFNLPTTEHQDAVFAYHFYRLIYRAKKIWLLYNSRTDGVNSGEESRYVKQMRYIYDIGIKKRSASHSAVSLRKENLPVAKNEEIMSELSKFIDNAGDDSEKELFSPSAFNEYILCGKKFYFNRVLKLSKPDEMEEISQPNVFGDIVHEVMKQLYAPYMTKDVTAEDIKSIMKNHGLISDCITEAFKKINKAETDSMSGYDAFLFRIVESFILRCLAQDISVAPFTLLHTEKFFYCPYRLPASKKKIRIGGVIDRIDRLPDGTIRICDYKTGKDDVHVTGKLMEDSKFKAARQLLFYRKLYSANVRECGNIELHVYPIRKLSENYRENSSTKTLIKTEESTIGTFDKGLDDILEEIFNPESDFRPAKDEQACKYCDFKQICG